MHKRLLEVRIGHFSAVVKGFSSKIYGCSDTKTFVFSDTVNPDWIHACDKCIQLLKEKRNGHTLAIHSNNQCIIKEFALKKPVGRMIVNAGATLTDV
jgi:hypothetical protein